MSHLPIIGDLIAVKLIVISPNHFEPQDRDIVGMVISVKKTTDRVDWMYPKRMVSESTDDLTLTLLTSDGPMSVSFNALKVCHVIQRVEDALG